MADLFEAEGRALRQSMLRLGWGLGLLLLALLLAAAAMVLCLWAVYQYLGNYLSPASASLTTGFLALLIAGVLGGIAQRIGR